VEQIKLTLDLERTSKVRLELGLETTRELVLLLAQAIVVVHLGARGIGRADVKQENDDVDDE